MLGERSKTLPYLPIISINLKVLKFFSLVLKRTWRSYLCFSSTAALNIAQFLDMFLTPQSVDTIMRNMYFLILWFNAVVRATYLMVRIDPFYDFLKRFEKLHHEIEMSADPSIRQSLKDATKNARRLAVTNLFLGGLVSSGFVIYPLLTNEPAFPYGFTIPGIDAYSHPNYAIIYAYQVIITPMGCCMYIPFTNIVVAFMMFGAVISQNLQSHLRNLKSIGDSNQTVLKKIVQCVKYHLIFINYTKTLNDFLAYIALLELVTFGATLCGLLFMLNIAKSFEQTFIICTYIVMILTQIFNLYWYANELSVQSAEIAVVAYDVPWTEFDLPSKKALQMIMIRAQQPLAITIGNIYPMTMSLFQSVLNTAYTFFTVFRGMYN